ncbi:sensor histidine kinase [Streptomyces sp. NPDC059649]|uniref:sensor histidine kinase n=1 Tax=Streptomyces sp. NPDC059649 TaxID=3346895 RepID=UPI00367921DB
MGETTPAVPELILGGLPTLVAAVTVIWALARRRAAAHRRLARPTAACALLSLMTTVAVTPHTGAYLKLVEAGLLLPLIAAVARWSPLRELRIAVPLAALAVAAWPAPLVNGSFLERTGVASFWLLPALAAAAIGGYPRHVEQRRRTAVTAARRAQRLQLSRDLHDFVAHDVSGIVVQAQAARFLAPTDPGQAVLALERIEKAGLNALEAMDRTMHMLDDDQELASTSHRPPGIAQLPTLIDDFTALSGTETRLHLPPSAAEAFTLAAPEAGALAYRIVAEALTNIHRHAPRTPRAEVRFSPSPTGMELRVTNEPPDTPSSHPRRPTALRRRGGRGLVALTDDVRARGGTLTAGPHGEGGWCLTAILPLSTSPTKEPKKRPKEPKLPKEPK